MRTWRKNVQQTSVNGFSNGIKKLVQASYSDELTLYQLLKTNKDGLNEETVEERQATFGLNEVQHEKTPSWIKQLLDAFVNPFIGILIFIAATSAVIDIWLPKSSDEDYSTIIMVGVMVMISAILRFVQEFKSNTAASKLKDMVETTATALRDKTRKEIDMHDIVPGDIIYLSAGDMIPADCRIIQSKDLFVVQSSLTGESLPVEKKCATISKEKADKLSPFELENICYMGTNVISGTAVVIVVNTG